MDPEMALAETLVYRVAAAAPSLHRALCWVGAAVVRRRYSESEKLAGLVVALLFVCALAAMIAKLIADRARFRCQYCNGIVMALWDAPEDLRRGVLSYLREHENRDPDVKGIFLCEPCKIVYDDFSGEKASRDADPYYGYTTFCKVCAGVVYGCDPGKPDIACGKCGTRYSWLTDERTKLRFLSAMGDVSVLKKAPSDRVDIY